MSEDSDGSITRWIANLESDDAQEAQRQLWNRYFRRLVGLARLKLGDAPRRAVDEEDVAIAALTSFFAGAAAKRFPALTDRDSLWPLLAKITAHKAIDQRRRASARKQGGGTVRGDSALYSPEGSALWAENALQQELTPDYLAAVGEQCRQLLQGLPHDDLRLIATKRLEGYSNQEIAADLGVVPRTVERKLGMIRTYWIEALQQDP